MNRTSYFPGRQSPSRNHFRRNSLDMFKKVKSTQIHQQQRESFRKSCSSSHKIGIKQRQDLPQIKYEKQMDNNIYFNPKSRAKYFKNLIDSYFQKKQDQFKCNTNVQTWPRNSYLLRKSITNNKNKQAQSLLPQKVKAQNNGKNSKKQSNAQKVKSVNQAYKRTQSSKYKQYQEQTILSQKNSILGKESNQLLTSKIQQQLYYSPSFKDFPQPSFLPKITQSIDDHEEGCTVSSLQQFSYADIFMRSQDSFSQTQDHKVLIYENSAIKIYVIRQNNRKIRIKEFKDHLFLNRHKKALQYNIQCFWKPYRFNQLSLMVPYVFSLKDMLFKLSPHPTSPDIYHITPRPLYHRLLANYCQDLFMLFKQFIKDISRIGGKVINNKINLTNLYYLNGKFCIGDWEYSAFKDQNKIQGNDFESRIQPILKCQKEWLVSPEYLASQILQSVDSRQPFNLWQHQNASDVYSIGISFIQIITLIPMWIQYKTCVKGKAVKPRQGCLTTTNRSIIRIIEKQRKLPSRISAIFQRQLLQTQKNWRFFNILLKMIEPNPDKRIGIDSIMDEMQRTND